MPLNDMHGFRITYLPVDAMGALARPTLRRRSHEQTVLITIMHANNETGTLQPIAEIAEIAHRHGVLLHS